MASVVEATHPRWFGAGFFAAREPTGDAADFVVLVDLDDPCLAAWRNLPPTASDLDDESQPLAGRREYFLRRRSVLRHMLAQRLGCAPESVIVAHGVAGAPRVVAPQGNLHISVSARGSFAALAISSAPVGVDIEIVAAPREPLWHVLHPGERSAIERQWREAASDQRFLETWAAKEASLKALGSGFLQDPAATEVRFQAAGEFEAFGSHKKAAACRGVVERRWLGAVQLCCASAMLRSDG